MPLLPRIKTSQDWNTFISARPQMQGNDLFAMRKACYEDIEKVRKRPLLVYATKFLESTQIPNNSIDLSDIDGFTDLVRSIKDSDEVDVLLHSPGGSPDATERIVFILRDKFKQVHFIIPHSAYSAATMLALSGDSITLHPSATLGPIDPQIKGIPARSIKKGFEKVKDLLKKEGPEALPAYIPLLEKYSLDILELCEDSEKLSRDLVSDWITTYMMKGKEVYAGQIKAAVEFFSNYDIHLLHSRPLIFNKIQSLQLKIEQCNDKLGELIWEAYVLINGFFGLTPFVKLYENCHGISWGKTVQPLMIQPPQPQKIQHNSK